MKKILIIDDEEAIRLMVKRLVEKAGYTAELASNGEEGMMMIDEASFDLVITDIIMPRKEGIEIITAIRKNYPEIRVIAMSGGGRFTSEGYLKSAKILGANRVFTKPFNHREMITAIDDLIGE